MPNPRINNPRDDRYVAAHEVAAYGYCPESYRLSLLNAPRSRENEAQLRAGLKTHASWQAAGQRRNIVYLIIAAAIMAYAVYRFMQIMGHMP